MKQKPSNSAFHILHYSISILAGSFIFGFLICLPILYHPVSPIPQVKAAYTSVPVRPKSSGIAPPEVTATGIYIVDMDSGLTLFAKNPSLRLRPASLTKIMTALIAMEYYDPDQVITVKNGPNATGSSADLLGNDSFRAADLLYALLLPSGNDAALTFAENYPGGYQAFIDRMNSSAHNLGLGNTHFDDVSGVDSPDQYTSAYDIAHIALTALKQARFRNVVSTKTTSITGSSGNVYQLTSTNELLGEPGILGVKTGTTPDAGECLVTFADKYKHPVLIAMLHSHDRFNETEKLLDWVYSNFIWE